MKKIKLQNKMPNELTLEQLCWIGSISLCLLDLKTEGFTKQIRIAVGLIALSDENNEIVLSYADISEKLDISLPTVSKSLVSFREKGFIESRRDIDIAKVPFRHTLLLSTARPAHREQLNKDEMLWFSSSILILSITSSSSSQKAKLLLRLIELSRENAHIRFTIRGIAKDIGVSEKSIVETLRLLVDIGCLKKKGHVLPDGSIGEKKTPSYSINTLCVNPLLAEG